MKRIRWVLVSALLAAGSVSAHDIPNARVDRSIQVEVVGRRIKIAYEVSLSELTLTQDLRALIGELPGLDRPMWFARYAETTAPLNAKGLIVRVGSEVLPLEMDGLKVEVDQHPRLHFHYSAPIPPSGSILVRDTNYAGSEGTSRLAVRGGPGVTLKADDLPSDVEKIPIRPVWQLTDIEEKRTREVDFTYKSDEAEPAPRLATGPTENPVQPSPNATSSLTQLLDNPVEGIVAWLAVGGIGILLGAAHSIQPGHGKTLAAAGSVSNAHPLRSALILSGATTLGHMATVVVIALSLYWAGGTDYAAVHQPLIRTAGFVIAATGLWRLGRVLGGREKQAVDETLKHRSTAGLIGLGLAAGLVPCWDAIGLVLIATSLGKPLLGLYVLAAFSIGMGAVLAAVAALSAKVTSVRTRFAGPIQGIGAVVLVAVGLWFLAS